jgi:hypothetical protein
MIPNRIIILYLGFFGVIGLSIWVTKNPWCLLALIFTPGYNDDD